MPKRGTLRIVRFGSLEYRYRAGRLEWRVPGRKWLVDSHSPEEFAAVGELKDRPTCEEEADAA